MSGDPRTENIQRFPGHKSGIPEMRSKSAMSYKSCEVNSRKGYKPLHMKSRELINYSRNIKSADKTYRKYNAKPRVQRLDNKFHGQVFRYEPPSKSSTGSSRRNVRTETNPSNDTNANDPDTATNTVTLHSICKACDPKLEPHLVTLPEGEMSQPGITFGKSAERAVDNLMRKAKSPVKNVKRLLQTDYEEKTDETIVQIEEDRTVSKPELPVLPLSGQSTFNSSPMSADNGRSEHQPYDSDEHEINAGLEPQQYITRTEPTRLVNTTLSQILPASLPKTMEKILDKLKRTGPDGANKDFKTADRDSAPGGRLDKHLVEPVEAHMLTNLPTQEPRQIHEKQTDCWRGLKGQVDKYVSPPRAKWNELKNHYIKLKVNSLKRRGITENGERDKAEEYTSDKTRTDVRNDGQTQGLDNRLRAKATAFLQLLPKGPFLNRKGHSEIMEESLSRPTETDDKITGKGIVTGKDPDSTQIRKPKSPDSSVLEGPMAMEGQLAIKPVFANQVKAPFESSQKASHPTVSGPESGQLVQPVHLVAKEVNSQSEEQKGYPKQLRTDKLEESSIASFPAMPESNLDFLDDYTAEFTLTGPKRNVDELVHQLQKNAVKLIELEQAYRVARLQTAQKKRIRPKRNKNAATKSQDQSVPMSKEDHKRDETAVPEAELDEVDSFLHQNATGVNKKLLDSEVLSPPELLVIKNPPNSDLTSRKMNERTESSLQKLSMGYENGTVQATTTTIPKKRLKQSVNTTQVKSDKPLDTEARTPQLAERDETKHSIHPKVDRDTSTTSVTTHGTKLMNEPSVSMLASESMFTGNTFSVKPGSDPMTTELDKSRLLSDKKTVIHKGIVKEPVPNVQPHLMNICGTPIVHPSKLYSTCVAECDTNVLGSGSKHTLPKPVTRCPLESLCRPDREVEMVRTSLTEPFEDLLTGYTPNAGPLVRHATDIHETTQPEPPRTITSTMEANAIANGGKSETQSGAAKVLRTDLAEKEKNCKYRQENVVKSDPDFRAQNDPLTTTVEAVNAKASTGKLNPTHNDVAFTVRKPTGQIVPPHILPTMSSLDINELKFQDSKVIQHTTLIPSIIDQNSKDHTALKNVIERMLDGTVDGQYMKTVSVQDTVVPNVTTESMDVSINESPSKLPTFTHAAQEDKQGLAGSVIIETTTPRKDQAHVENTRTETQRVSCSNVLSSPYDELGSPLKRIPGHTNIESVSKGPIVNEKNKKGARKYRSSAQKTILLSVMTSEQVNSDTATQKNPDDSCVKNAIPEKLKKSVAQHIPCRCSLDSRTNGEILESSVIRDMRSSSLQEPTMHPVRSIHRRTASRESPVSEELNQQGFTLTDPSHRSVWQYDKPAGDLVETQDTPDADKIAIRAEKPSRLLAISKLTFSRQLSEYTVDTDGSSAETVSFVDKTKKQTENQYVASPTIVIHRARSAASEHTEVRNIHTGRTSISRCAQTPHSGPVVWHHNHRKRHKKPSKTYRRKCSSRSSSEYYGRNGDACSISSSSSSFSGFSNNIKRELRKLSSEFLFHNRSRKHSKRDKNISVTWSHNSRQPIHQVSPVSDYSDERLSMAYNEIPPLESVEAPSQHTQPHSYSPDKSRSLSRPEQSEEISLSVCITQKTDSSSSVCSTLTPSSSLERIMRRKFRRLLYRSNKQRQKRAFVHQEYEMPQCYSEDSISTSSMYSNESWKLCNSKRRCRSQCPDVYHKREYRSSAKIPQVLRLFRLSNSLKDLSTHLIHRELKYLLIKRLLLRRALAERLVSQLIHTHRY